MARKPFSPYAILTVANKAFGWSPGYTLWGVSFSTLNGMLMENYYMQKHLEDEEGEYEWIDFPTIEGVKRIKRYFDKIDI